MSDNKSGDDKNSLFESDLSGAQERAANYYFLDTTYHHLSMEPNEVLEVPQSGWASLYIPAVTGLYICIAGQPERLMELGGCVALPSGRKHSLILKKNGHRDLIENEKNNAEHVAFVVRVSNTAHPQPDMLPPFFFLSKSDVLERRRMSIFFELTKLLVEKEDDPLLDIMRCRLADMVALELLTYIIDGSGRDIVEKLDSGFDERIRRALKLIHEKPSEDWTVQTIADAVNISRSSFARRFKSAVGESPKHYVTRTRINLATGYLQSLDWPVSAIAMEVGYMSETAFISAFKRQMGVTPGQYRKRVRDHDV